MERLKSLYGALEDLPPNELPTSWRRRHVLAHGHVNLAGHLFDLTLPANRSGLQLRHSSLLEDHGMRYLDVSDVTSKTRVVTQAIAQDLYSNGWTGMSGPIAGILYESNLDSQQCFALFEGRYTIKLAGKLRRLANSFQGLETVCEEFDLAPD